MATQGLKLCLEGLCALAGEGLEDSKELCYRCFKTTLVLAQGRSLPRLSQVLLREGCRPTVPNSTDADTHSLLWSSLFVNAPAREEPCTQSATTQSDMH